MLRSPFHFLLSLHRVFLRSKARRRSSHFLFRPITKITPWSAGIISRISNTSSPVFTKYVSILGQHHEQTNHLRRVIQQHSTSTSRRLFIHRRLQGNGPVCIQRRTMVSSGSISNGNSNITTVLATNHFFTPRPPILGVHGTPLLPPPPPASFRSYSTKSPWNLRQQQHFVTPYTSSSDNMDNVDDDVTDNQFEINGRPQRITHQYLLKTPTKAAESATDNNGGVDHGGLGRKQQSYRPPDIRGMADLMETNDDSHLDSNTRNKSDSNSSTAHPNGNGSKAYHRGLVHRGQPPRKSSPQQKRQQENTQLPSSSTTLGKMFTSPVDVLRHDDLSLQTTKKMQLHNVDTGAATATATTTVNKCLQQQWYISIPMDLTLPSPNSHTISLSTPLESLTIMENAVSILDPTWLISFDAWGKLIREHLAKVMVFIQLLGTEAERYCMKDGKRTTTTRYSNVDEAVTATMDFKMMMKKTDTCTELHIYLPHQLLAPLPTTRNNIHHWLDQLMDEPPSFEVKCHSPTSNTSSMDGLTLTTPTATTASENTTDDPIVLEPVTFGQSLNVDRMDMSEIDDDDLVMVPSLITEADQRQANEHNEDDNSSWHIGPRYFQGIHTFLNHVDSMIDSSPAFASSGPQRRFSL
ncbi:hypothetical protein BCR42DRAFT_399270 [Absidia repens]|uniref:Uncharacterized protein n=1 Tax=Absidia repens TaxID=90262 RepID=A0A1X2IZN9_9FUNG|nr:hypothetical protein BCR42DRAFT_399270 [Absidia repens]